MSEGLIASSLENARTTIRSGVILVHMHNHTLHYLHSQRIYDFVFKHFLYMLFFTIGCGHIQ